MFNDRMKVKWIFIHILPKRKFAIIRTIDELISSYRVEFIKAYINRFTRLKISMQLITNSTNQKKKNKIKRELLKSVIVNCYHKRCIMKSIETIHINSNVDGKEWYGNKYQINFIFKELQRINEMDGIENKKIV